MKFTQNYNTNVGFQHCACMCESGDDPSVFIVSIYYWQRNITTEMERTDEQILFIYFHFVFSLCENASADIAQERDAEDIVG